MKTTFVKSILFVLFAFPTILIGQQLDVLKYQYGPRLLNNPALTTNEGVLTGSVNYQKAFGGVDRAPTYMSLVIEAPFSAEKMGVGIGIQTEKAGLIRFTNIVASYAYHLFLGSSDNIVSLGLSGRFSQTAFDGGDATIIDQLDPIAVNANESLTAFNGSGGIAFTKKMTSDYGTPNLFTMGFSMGKLVPMNLEFETFELEESNFYNIVITGRFNVSNQMNVEPIFNLHRESSGHYNWSIGARSKVTELIYLGASYDRFNNAGLELGFNIDNVGGGVVTAMVQTIFPFTSVGSQLDFGYGINLIYKKK